MAKRECVFADRAVAAANWLRPFDDVLADAKAGAPGLKAGVQESDGFGRFTIDKSVYVNQQALLIRMDSGSCELWQQGWDDESFVPRYATL